MPWVQNALLRSFLIAEVHCEKIPALVILVEVLDMLGVSVDLEMFCTADVSEQVILLVFARKVMCKRILFSSS